MRSAGERLDFGRIVRAGFLLLAAFVAGCQSPSTQAQADAHEASYTRFEKGKAFFEEKCRTVAGEKVYRTVTDVEGIVLEKLRPPRGDKELSDRMWPGAAFAREAPGDEYIESFLGYEQAPGDGFTGKPGKISPEQRGYISTDRRDDSLPGYRFVDVIDPMDGQRYRYTGAIKDVEIVSSVLIGGDGKKHVVKKYVLEKLSSSDLGVRYGVTFEDHDIPEDRALGVASSTIRVIDLETKEVPGELIRYAWSPDDPSRANPPPWLTASRCPDHSVGTNAATRKIVDQVLIPRRDKNF